MKSDQCLQSAQGIFIALPFSVIFISSQDIHAQLNSITNLHINYCSGCIRAFVMINAYCLFNLNLHMSRRMGKPTICIGKNKGCEADQRLCFHYSVSTIPLLLNSKISSF